MSDLSQILDDVKVRGLVDSKLKLCPDCGRQRDRQAHFAPRFGRCAAHRELPNRQWNEKCEACDEVRHGHLRQPRCHECDVARVRRRGLVKRIIRLLQEAGLPKSALKATDASMREARLRGLKRAASPGAVAAAALKIAGDDLRLIVEPFLEVPEEVPMFEPLIEREPPAGAKSYVPVIDAKAAAGFARAVQYDQRLGYVDAQRRVSRDDFALRIEGVSMEPLIRDRSLCLFRRDTFGDHLKGQVVLVRCERDGDAEEGGRLVVKRLKLGQGHISLVSENPDFEPIPVSDSDAIRILARFIAVLRAG